METSISSGHLIANTVVCDNPCFLSGVQAYSNGTDAATLIIYDAGTASTIGKVLWKSALLTNATNFIAHSWHRPVECKNGIYVVVSGTGCGFVVEYME